MTRPRNKAFTVAKWVLIVLATLFVVTRIIRFFLQ